MLSYFCKLNVLISTYDTILQQFHYKFKHIFVFLKAFSFLVPYKICLYTKNIIIVVC